VQFLYESGLIAKDHPILTLSGADLGEADLSERTAPSGAVLRTDLRGANLSRADLRGANLHEANPTGANLSGPSWPTL
jgi:uncharacterized protein YjbI with pentapeptide repeats